MTNIDKEFLPIRINNTNLDAIFSKNYDFDKGLDIGIDTKSDFYKQALLLIESI